MDEKIQTLCDKVWEVVDVDKKKFIEGWRKIEEIAEETSSIPLNVKLLLSGVGFYDPVLLSTLTEKELDIAEVCGITLNPTGVSCGARHNCEEMIRRSLWGGHYKNPEMFKIKPGYRNVLLLVAKKTKIMKVESKTSMRTVRQNDSPVKESVPLCKDRSFLIQKINKWILSRRTTNQCSLVLDVEITAPGKAGIKCPYCPLRCNATFHRNRWIVSNFQKHYIDKHIKDYMILEIPPVIKEVKGSKAKKKKKTEDSIEILNLTEDAYSDTEMIEALDSDPLYYDE